ncbi:UDP-GlcNAc diphosphorylase/GlcNAc-1-P N-acetyltransferase, GlmU, bacterial-type [Gemmatirosa kalamazoonensis]|uniref:UDP-GlcNAc diphosphorylase/GlcNAc-1-P N-acetyltransferase, GlmU, bacterial-type n=1 Tax=Gemmatirosa kalamazoonensis TaxID=861299 RepID=W0RJW0_9BACT|nr:putative sugar nucleotidyl transferase [Gemmatirosa kalamazoonensis]AHG90707.1 UDP-GlcNAc diphosphorylase/GlcNAc-1-P N-acetyltransferase, GlmU, bacterial-type [Gemmatirosa kalamazoonensis]
MPPLILYDDHVARGFEPFALTRPVSELRAGAQLIRRRWERALGLRAEGFVAGAHLAEFDDPGTPPAATGVLPTGTVVANARAVVAIARVDAGADVWTCGGRVAAVRLREPLPVDRLADGALELGALAAGDSARRVETGGRWIDAVWDLVGQLDVQLKEDIPALAAMLDCVPHDGTVLGTGAVYVERGATIEPFVVLDTTSGPILVRDGATVQSFTRIIGPCYIGEGSTVVADRISGCSIGHVCKIHGEISATIVLGHSNKGHDGFVGHSYLGRWVNLGAGTTTSNLKNTYGHVALWTPAGVRDTGLQFLGTLFGDHAKTGIGLRLTTGTVLGAGSNVWDGMPPKVTPPFAWGGGAPYDAYDVEKFIQVTERAMARRHVTLSDRSRAQLRAAARVASEGCAAGRYAPNGGRS